MSIALPVRRRFASAFLAALSMFALAFGWLVAPTVRAADLPDGSTVWIGPATVGTLHPVYLETPDDPDNPGEPDFWAYCIENRVSAETRKLGTVGDWASFPGTNFFPNPGIAAKVSWVIANGYPAVSLEQLRTDIGFPGLTEEGAVEGTQYAIWRYTDLEADSAWDWADGTGSEEIYWYLVNGANATSGPSEDDLQTHVALTGPGTPQQAPGLIGPFVVATDQPTAAVTVDPALVITDASGTPIDPNAVVDGQELYVDARSTYTAGSVTMTASVAGSAATGRVVTVPTDDPQSADGHAQTLMLVAAAGTTNDASVNVAFAAAEPQIGTTVSVQGSANKVLPLSGGTVIDTVGYEGLIPGETYVLTGEIHTAPGGTSTGITGTATFTPDATSGTATVTFAITAEQAAAYAGQDLVVFEYLTLGGSPVAEHTDPTDGGQTFTIAAAPATTTTTTLPQTTTSTTAPQTTTSTTAPAVMPTTTVGAGPGAPSIPTGELPETGGNHTGLLLTAGTMLLAGSAALALTRRRSRV